jgi:hypothetical protein
VIALTGRFEDAVPCGEIHIDRPNFDTVFAGVAHKLGRCIEPHRLSVEDRGEEAIRMMALHP